MKNKLLKRDNKNIGLIFFLFAMSIFFLFYICININPLDKKEVKCDAYSEDILISDIYEQKINMEKDTLEEIALQFGTHKRNNTNELYIKLLDENKKVIEKWNVDASDIIDEKFYFFKLSKKLNGLKYKDIYISVSSNSLTTENSVAIGLNRNTNDSNLNINGNNVSNASLGYILVYDNYKLMLFSVSIITICIIFVVIIYFREYINKIKIHNLYAIIFPIIATMYLITLPIFKVPDETGHFARAFEISQGSFISNLNEEGKGGNYLPENIILSDSEKDLANISIIDVWNLKDEDLKDDKTFLTFPNISLYSPTCYFSQAIGIKFGLMFTNKIIPIFYLSRLFNLITIFLITYFSIKYIPVGKELMMLISLIPINMQENISIAPDGLVTATVFALVSFVIYMRYKYNGEMKNKHYLIMYTLGVMLSLYKIVYVPLTLLLFLIPKDRFKNRNRYFFHILILGSMILFSSLIWLRIASKFLIEFNPNVNTNEQFKFILLHPIRYFIIIINTIFANIDSYVNGIIGSSLGWFNISINKLIIYMYIGILISAITDENRNGENKFSIVFIFSNILVISVILLVFTSLYVQWTAVGKNIIDGIQGRYFIPLIFPCLIGRYVNNNNTITKVDEKRIILTIFTHICVIITLLYTCII